MSNKLHNSVIVTYVDVLKKVLQNFEQYRKENCLEDITKYIL